MDRIHLDLGQDSHDIFIEEGLLNRLAPSLAELTGADKVAVITEETVQSVYGTDLVKSLERQGLSVRMISIPSGEKSKNLHVVGRMYDMLADFGLRDSDALVALGGRVVGDVTGFVAATYRRGVAYVQAPTSVLSQIGSAIGGKISIDIPAGKNLIGTFWQPKAVYIDPMTARTLPARYFHNGLGEAVKYGAAADRELFEIFESAKSDMELLRLLPILIRHCTAVKAQYVQADLRDKGSRRLLDFGHLVGSAIERYYRHDDLQMTHGEATAVGMYMMTKRSELLGLTKTGVTARLEYVLKSLDLPVETDIPAEELLEEVLRDKKIRDGVIEVPLLKDIGAGFLKKLTTEELRDYIRP